MRPGPIRPGDPRPDTQTWRTHSRFNEARADSPGRSLAFSNREAAVL